MKVSYNNYLKSSVIECDTALAEYPATNIVTGSTVQSFIALDKSATIRISFYESVNIKNVYIRSNIVEGEGFISLHVYDDEFTTLNQTVDLSTSGKAEIDVEAQYFELSMGNTTDGVPLLIVSNVFMGQAIELPYVDAGVGITRNSTDLRTVSLSGQVYGTKGYSYREPTFNFKNLSFEQMETMDTIFKEVSNTTPIWVEIWDDWEPLYAVIEDDKMDFQQDEMQPTWSCTFTLREVF